MPLDDQDHNMLESRLHAIADEIPSHELIQELVSHADETEEHMSTISDTLQSIDGTLQSINRALILIAKRT